MTDDPGAFLAHFGVPCVAGTAQFLGLMDKPDVIVSMERGFDLHTAEYELTFATAAASLKRGDPISVAGEAYTVRQPPRRIDDGAFSVVLLTKV